MYITSLIIVKEFSSIGRNVDIRKDEVRLLGTLFGRKATWALLLFRTFGRGNNPLVRIRPGNMLGSQFQSLSERAIWKLFHFQSWDDGRRRSPNGIYRRSIRVKARA